MRKLISSVALVFLAALAGAPAFAQSGQAFPQKQYWASDYGIWSVPSQSANTYTFFPIGVCTLPTASQGSFYPFNTNAPVLITDRNASLTEIVTPSAVSPSAANPSSSSCGITISPANTHYQFTLTSATGGLQEVLNQIPSTVAYPVEVDLDRNWYTTMNSIAAQVSTQTAAKVINTVVGNSSAFLVDKTVSPFQYYSWNGTNYTAAATNITPPTVAAGAGAGTSPTIAIVGSGTTGIVTLTTGTTPTASAAIFTLTWPAIASGGFQYAPHCTVTSIGTVAYTGTNASVAGPPAVDTYTATSTALTASISGFKWKYLCY